MKSSLQYRLARTTAVRILFGGLLAALAVPAFGEDSGDCGFQNLSLPPDLVVFAAGGNRGRRLNFQIDLSGSRASRMDVVVNSTSRPVALILGTYGPTIWNVTWTRGTRIVAVLVGGYHRQEIAGLPRTTPAKVHSHDSSPRRPADGKCGYFYISQDHDAGLDAISKGIFGRGVDGVYLAKDGSVVAGESPAADAMIDTSFDSPPTTSQPEWLPLAGPAALADAVTKGILRRATIKDLKDWQDALAASTPDAGQERRPVTKPGGHNAYVVLDAFTFPAGLHGAKAATFLVPRGVPYPQGYPGHSAVYDFNSLSCKGALCRDGSAAIAALNRRSEQNPDAPSIPVEPAPTTVRPSQESGAQDACTAKGTAAQESICLANELRRTDGEINRIYEAVMAKLKPEAKKDLRAQQRSWLKFRDDECRLSSEAANRNEWFDYLLENKKRAVCVVRLTEGRLTYLNGLREQQSSSAGKARLEIEGRVQPQRASADYATSSKSSHAKGKWYFEIRVDHGRITTELEASLFAGISAGAQSFGSLYYIRPQDLVLDMPGGGSVTISGGNLGGDIRLPAVTTGIAVDLDNGKLYSRRANAWRDGEPGSPTGTDIKRGREYRAEITSSVPLADLVSQGIVTFNFGEKPFEGALPPGYAAYDQTPVADATAVRLGNVEILPSGSPVAGKPLSHWLQKYWEWGRGVEASLTPASDMDGTRCADRQSGPVWFLTGSNVTTNVTRTCDIPAGVHVLVPIMNALVQPDAGGVSCVQLTNALNGFGSEVEDLNFSVNRRALRDPKLYRAGSGCFSLNDVSRNVNGLAAGDGYWVVLKPLLPGRYEIGFDGRYASNGFAQHVRYNINVK